MELNLNVKSDQMKFREGAIYSIGIVAFLWIIKLAELQSGTDLSYLGILPRTLKGSVGIFTSAFVHGDFKHLISNSFPLLILLCGVVYFYNGIAKRVILLIYALTGIAVWVLARDAYHIGASGVVYGLVSFLFFIGLLRRDAGSIAISMTVIFLYSGMLYGLFPNNPEVSYESHIIGSIAGAVTAFVFRRIALKKAEPVLILEEPFNSSDNSTMKFKYDFKPDSENGNDNNINYRLDL